MLFSCGNSKLLRAVSHTISIFFSLKLLFGTALKERTTKASRAFATAFFPFLLVKKIRFILLSEDQKMRKHFDS